MFNKLLIANRGEIACRIARTAHRLGLRTVAVYSDADVGAQHVMMADEAVRIGGVAAAESYLKSEAIVAAAVRTGADAVHPGYGFLSENAEFAEACFAAGVTFVGPPPQAIRAMAVKHTAKSIMEEVGVPVVPGYHGDDQSEEGLLGAAREIGFPVLIKACAGGGGRGMRIVEAEDDFVRALAGAKREATSGFGDDRVLVERYLTNARHIEVQVFGDTHGNVIHLFERECSLQRRHQKVIEEAPAPGMTVEMRSAMGQVAVDVARAIDYVGAGTVEFIVDGKAGLSASSFYFMEMNTRLQVEHPVTELVTGLDLVEWQLGVAAGDPLPLTQNDVFLAGHAIEARIYAENPAKRFLPSPGRLSHLRLPDEGPHIRVDAGVVAGDSITPYYDPLIAKVIVWDDDRAKAVRRLSGALTGLHVIGLVTNRDFLLRIANHREFGNAALDTGFIDRYLADLVPKAGPASDKTLALAALAVLADRNAEEADSDWNSTDRYSPWRRCDGWRLNGPAIEEIVFLDSGRQQDGGRVSLTVRPRARGISAYEMDLPDGPVVAAGDLEEGRLLHANLDGVRIVVSMYRSADELWVVDDDGHTHRLSLEDPTAAIAAADYVDLTVAAPLPGRVSGILAGQGDRVRKGAGLAVIEAMKMEHTIVAPADGVVGTIHFDVGDLVEEGVKLLDFEGHDGSSRS